MGKGWPSSGVPEVSAHESLGLYQEKEKVLNKTKKQPRRIVNRDRDLQKEGKEKGRISLNKKTMPSSYITGCNAPRQRSQRVAKISADKTRKK